MWEDVGTVPGGNDVRAHHEMGGQIEAGLENPKTEAR